MSRPSREGNDGLRLAAEQAIADQIRFERGAAGNNQRPERDLSKPWMIDAIRDEFGEDAEWPILMLQQVALFKHAGNESSSTEIPLGRLVHLHRERFGGGRTANEIQFDWDRMIAALLRANAPETERLLLAKSQHLASSGGLVVEQDGVIVEVDVAVDDQVHELDPRYVVIDAVIDQLRLLRSGERAPRPTQFAAALRELVRNAFGAEAEESINDELCKQLHRDLFTAKSIKRTSR